MRTALEMLFGEHWQVGRDRRRCLRGNATAMGVGWLGTETLVAKITQT
ncbi:MAG: hypothetical protein WA991_12060 [Ornithinimicrobium sp.]